ncbi:ssDNA endonuclease and repair protein rad10 [Coemansia sp. RSA 2706]|nr:ssDNA endonuclease and repair protein rad10 [Coemansia sp. RSA 2706]KAJ2329131.1 ssDNA endonuclease and repair protein rad10 [Coemansia sp. RSA 2702]KAJ2738436.1 ssDNA endonuclease and repair protein rad10 [Coemansia sp. Cherry 401B]
MSDPADKPRRFHIPTVEEIEQRRREAEQRLAAASTELQPVTTAANPAPAPPPPPPSASATSASAPAPAPSTHSPSRASNQTLQVNELQRGNPLLSSIRNVRWTHNRGILPDFEMSPHTCALYLSIKYHRLHPDYIARRIDALGRQYTKRVLLVYVDTEDSKLALREINKAAVVGEMTLLLAWSLDEAGRYVEALKVYENRPPDVIRERVEDTFVAQLAAALTSIRSVNKADVLTLAANFRTISGVAMASVEELSLCPGIGELKAQRIFRAFNEPFVSK